MKRQSKNYIYFFSLFILLFIYGSLYAKDKATIVLVLQDENAQPIDLGVVSLFSAKDSSLVKSAFSDQRGQTLIEDVKPGSYYIRIYKLGYQQTHSGDVLISENNTRIDLGTMVLKSSVKELNEATVKAQKPFIETTLDRVIVNVENSITAAGSSVLEVLEKSPGIHIDQNDNISMKGKQGVIVMQDGKPILMTGSDLANLLKGMPSASVEKIELISNPSAKYDANGNAGIINIKSKKDKKLGTNGNVNLSLGHGRYIKSGEGFSLNHRNKKINIFGNYNYAYRKGYTDLDLDRKFYESDTYKSSYVQKNRLIVPVQTNTARVGADWSLNKNTMMGVVLNGFALGFNPLGNNHSDELDSNFSKASYFETRNRSSSNWNSFSGNYNFKHTFDSSGAEISVDADYARYGNRANQNYTTSYFDLNNNSTKPDYILIGDISGSLDIKAMKADYSLPFKDGGKLESGLKTSQVTADNDLKYYNRSSGVNIYDTTKSNHFIYNENINAAYLNYSKEFKVWGMQLGTRAEQSRIHGNQIVTGQKLDSSYIQFFPSVFFHYKISTNHDLGLKADRRIDRPTYDQLNPFKFYLDPSTYKEGNPYLKPQLSNSIEVSDTYKDKFTFSLSYSRTSDNITQVVAPSPTENKITIQTDKNISTAEYYSFSMNLPFDVMKGWNSSNSINAYYGKYKGYYALTNLDVGSFAMNVNSTNSFILKKDYSAEVQVFYRTPEVYAFMNLRPNWQLSAGIKKSILKNKGTLKLNISDIFYSQAIRATTQYSNYHEYFIVNRDTRVVSLAFVYRFGNKNVSPARRINGGADEEKKRVNTNG